MKKKLFLSIIIIYALSLTTCGNAEPVTETTVIEETSEEVTTIAETTIEINTEKTTIVSETTAETPSTEVFEETSPLNPAQNITINEDGTYSFTDDFLVAIQEIDGMAELKQEYLEKCLAEAAPFIVDCETDEEVVNLLGAFVGIYSYEQAKVEQEQVKSEPNTNNSSNTQNESSSGSVQQNQTPAPEQNTSDTGYTEETGSLDYLFGQSEDDKITHSGEMESGSLNTHH